MRPMRVAQYRAVFAALGVFALVGCATFSQDGGFAAVEATAQERLGTNAKVILASKNGSSVNAFVKERLSAPLAVDDAVQIALLNNRGLQGTYESLGIAEADLVQAGRLTNPHFAYLNVRNSESRSIEWALTFPIIDLLTMPLRRKIEAHRFEQTKLEVSSRVLDIAFETRRAYFQAVAANEMVRYLEQVNTAAEASAELARRMVRAGNFPKLTQMREQIFYAETVAQLAQAKRIAVSERERLTRLMGLFGEDIQFNLPGRLPDLPAVPPVWTDLEAKAIAERLDIQAAKRQTESVAALLGLTKTTRFINALELGPARTKEGHDDWTRGIEISLQIPLFDWGGARVAKAEAQYMQAVHRLAEIAVNARSEVRDAFSIARTAYDTTKHYRDEIVPLRKKISEENLLRYNGMLIGVFELLADAREQVMSVTAYITALREFWLAATDLQAALNGPGGPNVRAAGGGGTLRPMNDPVLAGH